MSKLPTRGERNNNPLNIRHNPNNKWQGLVGADSKGFCAFVDLRHGIRAALLLLHRYLFTYRCDNVELIVSKWAPACENDVEAYIKTVCRITKFDRKQPVEWKQSHIVPLVQAMARVESQMHLSNEIIVISADERYPIL